jgi:hypothetical protein
MTMLVDMLAIRTCSGSNKETAAAARWRKELDWLVLAVSIEALRRHDRSPTFTRIYPTRWVWTVN